MQSTINTFENTNASAIENQDARRKYCDAMENGKHDGNENKIPCDTVDNDIGDWLMMSNVKRSKKHSLSSPKKIPVIYEVSNDVTNNNDNIDIKKVSNTENIPEYTGRSTPSVGKGTFAIQQTCSKEKHVSEISKSIFKGRYHFFGNSLFEGSEGDVCASIGNTDDTETETENNQNMIAEELSFCPTPRRIHNFIIVSGDSDISDDDYEGDKFSNGNVSDVSSVCPSPRRIHNFIIVSGDSDISDDDYEGDKCSDENLSDISVIYQNEKLFDFDVNTKDNISCKDVSNKEGYSTKKSSLLNKTLQSKIVWTPTKIAKTLNERYNELTSLYISKNNRKNRKLLGKNRKQRTYNMDYEIFFEPILRKIVFSGIVKNDASHHHSKANAYTRPLFQQMREEQCRRVAHGYQTGSITTENLFFLTELIKDALLFHHQKRLSMAVLGLCYIPEVAAEMLWKVGSEVLKTNNCGHQFLVSFQQMMRLLCYHEFLPEIVMDYTSSLLINENDVHEAYQVATAVVSKERFSSDIYYNILYGQLEYVLWKLECNRVNSSKFVNERLRGNWGNDDDDDDSDETDENQLKGNAQMAFHGQRTIQYFKKVEEEVGIWDLIIPKYMEVLTFYEGKERAVEALKKHMHNNPYNPNSYEYYLHYIDESTKEREDLVDTLEKYCALDPTNNWGKELLALYKKRKCYNDLLALLIKRLDHRACCDSYYDWRLLYNLATMREESCDIKQFFEENLSHDSSWARYHFPVPLDTADVNLSKRVLLLKCKIAECLNIDRFSDCVDTWIRTKTLNFHDHVEANGPIILNISLNGDHELNNSYDELAFLSSPEILSCGELENNESQVDLDSTFMLDSSAEEILPDAFIIPENDIECYQTVNQIIENVGKDLVISPEKILERYQSGCRKKTIKNVGIKRKRKTNVFSSCSSSSENDDEQIRKKYKKGRNVRGETRERISYASFFSNSGSDVEMVSAVENRRKRKRKEIYKKPVKKKVKGDTEVSSIDTTSSDSDSD